MSFRARLTLVAAAAVALAVVAASALVYVVVRGELRGPVDNSLRQSQQEILGLPPDQIGHAIFEARANLGRAVVYPQVVKADGTTLRPTGT